MSRLIIAFKFIATSGFFWDYFFVGKSALILLFVIGH